MRVSLKWGAILETAATSATLVAALALAWAVVWPRVAGSPRPSAAESPISEVSGVATTAGVAAQGDNRARVAIVEFSDFECPFCGKYARETYPQVAKELIDKGVVSYSFRHYPLETIHKDALKAGEAAACAAEQGRFWEMHDQLFRNQNKLDEPSLVAYGSGLGLEESRFKSCLQTQMVNRIREDQKEAKRFGINSTPSFLVGLIGQDGSIKVLRKFSGAKSYETFKAVVDDVLKGA